MSMQHDGQTPCKTVACAARCGDAEQLKRLISEGHPVDAADNRGWRPIHCAASANFVDCLKVLLDYDETNVNWQSYEGYSVLYVTAESGCVDTLQLLLERGADPNVEDTCGNTPLLSAVKANSLECVKLLVSYNADINKQQFCGTAPLHEAATLGLLDIVNYLLEQGASLHVVEDFNITPIFTAAQYGQTECLKAMLKTAEERGETFLVNTCADDLATPLFLAAQEGYPDTVSLLIQYGADANATTKNPKALPLHAALEFKRVDCVKVLLPVTDRTVLYSCDRCPYNMAFSHLYRATHPTDHHCTQILVDHSIDVNRRHKLQGDDEFEPKIFRYSQHDVRYSAEVTPLTSIAVYDHVISHAKILLSGGAYINPTDSSEVPCLLAALNSYKLDLVSLLIEHGANVNIYHPGIVGNMTVIVCLHYWKGLKFMLKCGAEPKSVFQLPENEHQTSSQSSESNMDFSNSHGQSEQAVTKKLAFQESLSVEVRYIMTRAKVPLGKLLFLVLNFMDNFVFHSNLEGQLELEERKFFKSIAENPRSLMHLCRLAVRKCILPKDLHAGALRQLPLPSQTIDYLDYAELGP